ncbi:ribbon-helix-helix domain-containing protein [Rhizobium sp. RM]|uniref:ribbon-helix-helix domain-containing protein n=1 Tax=Rhizobium sp. RM TaxID=2748079 RepID=UPI00110F145C|nr:ribbon-helix-helix domain-containing protein [Rhizobium sp. RM]NWJ25606.1 ribbon-helix-helix domain-containing protein [Rhizobium sp. RM]TMV20094.1 ribbon-helix-helix domain-containing protein [Rhizobium sp. Td3]
MVNRKLEFGDVKLPLGKSRIPRIEEPAAPPETLPQTDLAAASPESGETTAPSESFALRDDAPSDPSAASPQRKRFVGEGIIALRSHRKQSSQTLFNVSLDEPLKERLERASFETKVKQTVIVRAAINAFLKKEGY